MFNDYTYLLESYHSFNISQEDIRKLLLRSLQIQQYRFYAHTKELNKYGKRWMLKGTSIDIKDVAKAEVNPIIAAH